MIGDTAWSLIADLREGDIELYLDDRSRRGFNAIIVNLIEYRFSTDPPRNRKGIEPFEVAGDFATPNPAYFNWARRVVGMAEERGIAVWLCPAYLGWNGGGEGFFQEIEAGGVEKLRAYGRFIGERFGDLANIVWMVGGDYAMPEEHRWAAIDLAVAIREAGAKQLITAHGGQQSAVETVGEQPWLDIDNSYRYELEVFRSFYREYERTPVRPFVLIEGIYENEHDAQPEQIRRQAYWAMTAGACGQFFGNNPIWHFDGPELFASERGWREELDSTGARDMEYLRNGFWDRPWHRLVPDREGAIVVDGVGEGIGTVTAAATPEGDLAMIYLPSTGCEARELSVDLSCFSKRMTGIWYNPTGGSSIAVAPEMLANAGSRHLSTPGDNGTGTNDWLLILEGGDS